LLEEIEGVAEFVLAEEAGIDEDVGEARADGAVSENGGDSGIHAAAEGAEGSSLPYYLANGSNGLFDEGGAVPGGGCAADGEDEVTEDFGAAFGVIDFGMELHGEKAAAGIFGGRDGGGGSFGEYAEALGEANDVVAVALPNTEMIGKAGEQGGDVGTVLDFEFDGAVFAAAGTADGAAEDVGDPLEAVTDAEDGNAEVEDTGIADGGFGIVNGAGTAGED
jgi:hypothetical protein